MNNGTQVITSLGAEALYRADMIAKQADVIAAFTTEVLEGVPGQFDEGACAYMLHVKDSIYSSFLFRPS